MEDEMARTNFERLRVYQLSEKLADQVWDIVLGWNNLARDTVGKQLFVLQIVSARMWQRVAVEVDIWTTNALCGWPGVRSMKLSIG